MRTTLTISDDLAEKAKRKAASTNRSFKEVINLALRFGLDALEESEPPKPFKTVPRGLGLREGLNYDNISELIALTEGEDFK